MIIINASDRSNIKGLTIIEPIINSNNKVADRIASTLLQMLKTKQLDEIRIIELVERADVSRNSFYRNFKDKDDVLRYSIKKATDEWYETDGITLLSTEKEAMFFIPLLEHMFHYRDSVAILMRNHKMHLLEEEFDRRIAHRLENTKNPWKSVYLAGGIYKVYRYWAESGYRESPEQISRYLSSVTWK